MMPETPTPRAKPSARSAATRRRAAARPKLYFYRSVHRRPDRPSEIPDYRQIQGLEDVTHQESSDPSPQPSRASVRLLTPADLDSRTERQNDAGPANPAAISATHAESAPRDFGKALTRDFETYAPDLPEALLELYEVQSEAREEEGVVPGDGAVEIAKRLLMDMYRISPRFYAVYPMPDGEIAIDAATRFGTSLVVLCNPDGSAQCLTYIDEEYRTEKYPDTGTLPDDFIRKALLESTPLTDS